MFNFLPSIKKSIAELTTGVGSLKKEIETKKRQRENLLHAPIPRKELADGLCAMIDKQAAIYPQRLAQALAGLASKPMYDYESSMLDIIGTIGGGSRTDVIPKQNFAWFCGDQMKQRLRDAVTVMDWPDDKVGPPRAERIKAIEKLDAEIADLQERLKAIMDEAHSAGINL